jgi:hypothetical protein
MATARGNSNRIQHRRGTAAEWTAANPVLRAGELGYETDTAQLKFGDGVSQWTALNYAGGFGASNLNGLSDVELTSPAAGEVLRYDGSAWRDQSLTKSDVGLGNVANTAPADLPVSTATQSALDGKAAATHSHGSISSAGAIGAASGQIIVTTTGGALTAAATISASSVSGLATVATTGSYNDLSNKPTTPTASASTLGLIRIGPGLSIDGSGIVTASGSAYTLPAATVSSLGGVIVGGGLAVASGTVSVSYGDSSGTACQGNDSRLSDTRTPTDGSVTMAKIAGSAVTYAKIQDVSVTDRILGRSSPGAGPVEEIVCTSAARSILDDTTTAAMLTTLGAASSSHAHGQITSAGAIGSDANRPIITAASGVLSAGSFGNGANTFCQGNDPRLSDSRNPLSHKHGFIDNSGAIGSTAGLPIITTTSGVLSAGSFGTTSGTFCKGDDSRLSDQRTPTDGSVTTAKLASSAVTYDKIQNMASTDRLLGRSSAGAGVVQEIICTAFARSILDDATASDARSTLDVQPTTSPTFVASSGLAGTFTGSDLVQTSVSIANTNTRTWQLMTSGLSPVSGSSVGAFVLYDATSAASRLAVTSAGVLRMTDGGSATGPVICSAVGGDDTGLWFPGADVVAVSSAGTERLRITATGAVGVGTSSPGHALHVSGSGARGVGVTSTDGNAAQLTLSSGSNAAQLTQSGTSFFFTNYGSGGSLSFVQEGAGTFSIFTNSSERLRISSGGQVGIGTSAPTISSGVGLHIAGSTLRLGTTRTPASSTATGNQGEICWDSSYIYVCVATNSWKRIALSTF